MIFDLGIRKDWKNFAPTLLKLCEFAGITMQADKDVVDILEEGGIRKEEITAVIWRYASLSLWCSPPLTYMHNSHWHFDHVGDTSRFAPSTELVVGPGFSDALIPGYPANENSPILETDYKLVPSTCERSESDLSIGIGPFESSTSRLEPS